MAKKEIKGVMEGDILCSFSLFAFLFVCLHTCISLLEPYFTHPFLRFMNKLVFDATKSFDCEYLLLATIAMSSVNLLRPNTNMEVHCALRD